MCSMCPFRMMPHNKTVQYTVSKKVGSAGEHQQYLLLNVRTGFLKKEDILVHDNCAKRASSENSELGPLLRSEGAGAVPLLVCSPELSPSRLVFSAIVQRVYIEMS